MSPKELRRGRGYDGHYRVGWLVSLLLHSSIIVGAVLFTQRVQLAPQPEPFTWNVALVSPESPPIPSAAASSAGPSPALTPAKPANPSTMPRREPAPLVPEPSQSQHLPQKAPAMTAITSSTQLPQTEVQLVKPVPQTVTPAPPVTVKAGEPVVLAPVAPPPPVEPIKQAPVPVESVTPLRQTTDSETASVPPQKESDSAMGATVSHSESPTSTSSVPSPSSELAPSITPRPSEAVETAVPAASSVPQVAALAPPASNRPARVDYGWLSEVILRRVEELKRYPAEARVDRTEGKVVVKAVINEDGSVDDVEVFQSSGSTTLDKAAIDLMRRAAPFSLPQLLGKPRVTIKIPMNYRLDR